MPSVGIGTYWKGDQKKCTVEIPIRFKGKLKFLFLPTKQLHSIPTEKPCNKSEFIFLESANNTLLRVSGEGSVQVNDLQSHIFQNRDDITKLEELDLGNAHQNNLPMAVPICCSGF